MALDPALPSSLKAVLDDFRRRLANLERSPRLTSASIRNGLLRVLDATGKAVVELGTKADETVLRVNRADGRAALWMGRTTSGTQFTSFVDKNGRIVVSDDAVAGGLATPWIPAHFIPLRPLGTSGYVIVESAEGTGIKDAYFIRFPHQHPKLFVEGNVWTDGNTTARLRLYNGGTVLHSQDFTTAGAHYFGVTLDPADLGTADGAWRGLDLKLQRLSGTSFAGVRLQAAMGRQS